MHHLERVWFSQGLFKIVNKELSSEFCLGIFKLVNEGLEFCVGISKRLWGLDYLPMAVNTVGVSSADIAPPARA